MTNIIILWLYFYFYTIELYYTNHIKIKQILYHLKSKNNNIRLGI